MAKEEFASGGEHTIPESLVSPPNPPSPASKAGMNPLLLKPECKTALSDFIRIFSFSTWLDRVLVSAAVATSIGAGITMPLMNMIFGRMVGSFTGYYGADASTTYELFKNAISSCAWSLTLVTSSGLVLIIVVYAATTPFLVKHMNGVQYADLQASIVANEVFSSMRMIAACGAQEKMAKRYVKWVDDSRHRGLKMSPIIALQQAPVQFSIYATFALSFWYSIRVYYELRFNSAETLVVCVTMMLPAMFTAKYRTKWLIGLASSVLMSIVLMTTSVSGITSPLSAAIRAAGAATVFYTIIDAIRPDKTGLKDPDVSASQDIVLQDVNFAYPTRPDLVILNNLSIRFPMGKTTAVVGPSGSGKTTIVGLLMRWYEIESLESNDMSLLWRNGLVEVGGRPLREIDLKWWRTQIGLVQQEPFLFNCSIYQNVEFGLVGTEWENANLATKEELVKQACREAFVDEFINRLPEGYSTIVGDAGIKLSGGQRQRIAIARSIVKRPKILILDEATSSIDVRGEQVVQAALEKVSKDRTTIMIAHRLGTVKKADNIIVLQKGQAVQQGTHSDLLAEEGGAYWALATSQKLVVDSTDPNELPSGLGGKVEDTEVNTPTVNSGSPVITTDASVDEELITTSRLRKYMLLICEQKEHWKWYAVVVGGAIGGGASQPISAYLFATELTLFQSWGPWLPSLSSFWSLMFVMLAILVAISYFVLGWSSSTIAFHITHRYRCEYFDNIISQSIGFFDTGDHSVGTLTARLATDPSQLQEILGINMAFVLISILNVAGCLIISFYYGWKLTIVTLCSSMPLIVAASFLRIRHEARFEKMNNEVFAESAKFATESITAFRTVSALTLEDTIIERYETLLREHVQHSFGKSSWFTLVFAVADSIALLCTAFVLWYGGSLMLKGEYWPFQYMIVYIAVLQGGLGAGQWLSYGPNIAKANVAVDRILEMRAKGQENTTRTPLDRGSVGDKDSGVRVEFRDVRFRYPTRNVPVLNGLDITVEKNMFAAIVGPSGCGKTTVVSLLERFYAVNSGQILYNGTDISTVSLEDYRRDMSLVAQEPNLFDGTIKENILLGVNPDSTTEEQIQQACRDAEIHEFIMSLPDGYNTEIGSRGVTLSGGQKQRVAITRALIRNPRLLLLDEATSNLDGDTERAVQAVLERTRKNRTMIMVAHRLATIQNADIIFVLGDGRVLEKGNHAALLRMRGIYYQMCQAQALDR
ncbi:P-loop containing nucleoside triphosphate hydrolase protein [Neurospora crassa]|uniref:Multidrug resistance protein 3 n=1 Tax=Neurospora crassa (strain ATCC 24698 / 74-OR23-1A / CBS 708.71 / DSM 1257 / FGSC 987) TaxID=367110 RepID=Q7S2E6_NEUCR|nr:multidrug resistance protein 3 [Neurospora crassa OR74A]EAA29583.2 multidrug resistance protein 3 [Neurospora crassa OR74A]KHE87435.1 P-loop containing nucleoside triphosphate hydrolase protein [Neurospora crassa]|eukprot:XP_958819.2 multidrug resistance protein 3 [Neurospora crassa OR74A]